MSKKSELKKQNENQANLKRLADLDELDRREAVKESYRYNGGRKAEKLRRQSEKQSNMKRLADLDELEEMEAAKHGESKGAKKLRRKAKRGYTGAFIVLFIIIMTAAFCYSGFFYGGVTMVGSFGGYAELIARKTAALMGIGDVIMLVGIVLCMCKKYILQAPFCLIGAAVYMYSAYKIVSDIQQRMETVYLGEDLEDMDIQYMLYYYPILLVALFSLVLLGIAIVRIIRRKRKEKIERDNAPVESIVS
ncbi:MAG: hypothetical protein LUE12_01035 [Ruminococcus sp.]|nr:hypothetical protein [Ruminococcus sp.]